MCRRLQQVIIFGFKDFHRSLTGTISLVTKARSCILRCIPTKDSNCYLSCLESVVLPEPVLSIAPILEDGLVSKVTEHPSLPTLVDELEHLEEEKEDEESCEDDASKILDDILDVQKTASPVVSAISSVAAALEPTSISMVDIVDALFNDANTNAKQPVEEDCDDDDEPVMIEQEEEEDCEHNVVPSVSAVSASAGLSNINIDDWMNSLVSQAVTAQQPRSTVTGKARK